MLTQSRLKELMHYDPDSGVFTRKVTAGPRGKAGSIAGYMDTKGYLRVEIDGKGYKLHRLAFFYMTSRWPADQVDHKDNNRSNNSWGNLREANNQQNNANIGAQRNNKLGIKGVHQIGPLKFRASIRIDGKLKHLGYHKTPEAARDAYSRAANESFGQFARSA